MNLPHDLPPSRGSLLFGFLLAWGCLIAGYGLAAMLLSALAHSGGGGALDGLYALLIGLPWFGMIGLIVWFAANNQPRSALGVLLGIGSMVGIALLLVATCFALLSSSGWH